MRRAVVTARRRGPSRPLHEDLQELLVDMGLRSGDPVPSETELIDVLGVSRGTLREAIKQLQALGIIETRHGTGMFIAPFSLAPFVSGLVFHGKIARPEELVQTMTALAEVRELLEFQLIRRVATEIDEHGLARVRGKLELLGRPAEFASEFDDADVEFHTALYRDLGNSLVLDLVDAFWKVLRVLRPQLDPRPISREHALAKHEAIVEALEAHDPVAAEDAMRVHFDGTRRWLAGLNHV